MSSFVGKCVIPLLLVLGWVVCVASMLLSLSLTLSCLLLLSLTLAAYHTLFMLGWVVCVRSMLLSLLLYAVGAVVAVVDVGCIPHSL